MEFFVVRAGISLDNTQLHTLVKRQWKGAKNKKLQQVYKAIPHLVFWELWKRRNSMRHWVDVTLNTMIHNVLREKCALLDSGCESKIEGQRLQLGETGRVAK